nr:hypothetical protein [uncultured Methanobrevibacter sp.]
MKTPLPERIYIEKNERMRYRVLREKLGKNVLNVDVFSLAMVYGYMNNLRIPLKRKEGLFRTISARDNFYSLLTLLYINEKDEFPKNFNDLSEAVIIAQEYANGGLKLLEDEVNKDEYNFSNKLSSIILKFNFENDFSEVFKELKME